MNEIVAFAASSNSSSSNSNYNININIIINSNNSNSNKTLVFAVNFFAGESIEKLFNLNIKKNSVIV